MYVEAPRAGDSCAGARGSKCRRLLIPSFARLGDGRALPVVWMPSTVGRIYCPCGNKLARYDTVDDIAEFRVAKRVEWPIL